MYGPSHCVARTMLVTACTSLLTLGLASLGLFAMTKAKDYRDILLTVDTLALLCSITMAVVSIRSTADSVVGSTDADTME